MIVDELLEIAEPVLGRQRVTRLCVGLRYTAVQLDSGSVGVALNLPEEAYENSAVCTSAGRLTGNAMEVAALVRNFNAIDLAAGLATINAALNHDIDAPEGDLIEGVSIAPTDRVGMVGYFGPLVARLKDHCRLVVFERDRPESWVYPDWAAEQLLGDADVVILSAATLVNKTADHLLSLARTDARVVLAGPTTPLVPEVFARHGVTSLAGMQFVNPEMVMNVIGQAGGTREFSSYARKVLLPLSSGDRLTGHGAEFDRPNP